MTYASLSAELGITSGQLKTWRLELLAAGSAKAALFEYIEIFYNCQRRHSSIG